MSEDNLFETEEVGAQDDSKEVVQEQVADPAPANTDTSVADDKKQKKTTDATPFKSEHTNQVVNPLKPHDKDKEDSIAGPLYLFNDTQEKVNDALSDPTVVDEENGVTFSDDFRDSVAGSIDNGILFDTHNEALKEGQWDQKPTYEGKHLALATPMFSSKNNNDSRLSGLKAVSKVQSMLGIGSPIIVPLWHSGFIIKMRAPTDTQILNYKDRINAEKIALGRQTGGAIYSNSASYINEYLVDLIEDLIYHVSVEDFPMARIAEHIKEPDLGIIAWAMACAIYPTGYHYERPCTENLKECQHIAKGLLDLNKLLWVDMSRLKESQLEHMMKQRSGKVTLDEVKAYVDAFGNSPNHSIKSEDYDLTINLKLPNLQQNIDHGHAWINDVEQSVREVFGQDISDSEVNEHMYNRARLTILRSYSHYIKSIVYDDGSVTDDEDTINSILETLSGTGKLFDFIMKGLNKYIDTSNVAVVAVPREPCQNCKQMPSEDIEAHPWLLPINPVRLFFIIGDRKLQQSIQS